MRITALILLALLLPGLIFSVTHTVKLDGNGNFLSIQTALDASSPGDTVLVYPGRYYENVIIQTNNISLISLEAQTNNPTYIDSTIIDGNQSVRCIRIYDNIQDIYVRGFSITNGFSTGSAGGIGLRTNSSSTLVNLKIHNNTASLGGGINIGAATVTLSGVSIYDNYSVNAGGGIFGTGVTGYPINITFDPVNRCSIYNNRSGSGQDIFVQNATSDLNVYLDTFSVAEPTTYYAIFTPQNEAPVQMTIDVQNAHHQEINNDLYVAPNGNDANDGLSPDTPLKTIHEGIYRIAADSLSQKTVHLLPGTYSRTANDQIFPIALKSWVKVQGSGIDSTVIVGEPHPTIPVGYGSADVVFKTYVEPVVSLADMSITTQNTDNGNAIICLLRGSINLKNLRIHDVKPNYVSSVLLWLSNDHDSVWDNVIIENEVTSDKGLVNVEGRVSGRISNCKFRNATSTYTSASVWAYPLVLFRGDGNLTFDNCEFSNLTMLDDNSYAIAVGGVQFPQQSNNFSFNNCLFSNNTSQGGVVLVGSSNNPNMNFTNCTFADNQSDTYTLITDGNVNITNSIFNNNSPYQIKVNPMSGTGETTTLNIDYSNIKDGIAGILQAPGNTINYLDTNINTDPGFAGGDDIHNPLYYNLSGGSPCVNAGTPDASALDLPPYDLAGNWRVWNNRIDIGCFEYGAEPWVTNDDPELTPVPVSSLSAYPNPFRSFTNLNVNLDASKRTASINDASISIYNLKGQRVKSISLDPGKSGTQLTYWDGNDNDGNACASGIYFLNLMVNGRNVSSKKVSLIK